MRNGKLLIETSLVIQDCGGMAKMDISLTSILHEFLRARSYFKEKMLEGGGVQFSLSLSPHYYLGKEI